MTTAPSMFLVADLWRKGIEAAVPPGVREIVEAVDGLEPGSEDISFAPIMERLQLDKNAVSRRARSAVVRGYLKNLEDRKGRPARLVVGDPMPGEIEIIAALERLAERITVSGVTVGYKTPHPPARVRAPTLRTKRERWLKWRNICGDITA